MIRLYDHIGIATSNNQYIMISQVFHAFLLLIIRLTKISYIPLGTPDFMLI